MNDWKPFNLDLYKDKDFMDLYNTIKDHNILDEIPLTPEGKISVRIQHKDKDNREAAFVPWDQVQADDVLWMLNEDCGVYMEIGVTLVYEGVVFYKWMNSTDDKIYHFEIGSLKATKMVYPYSITLPKDIIIVDIYNPKQIYNYV